MASGPTSPSPDRPRLAGRRLRAAALLGLAGAALWMASALAVAYTLTRRKEARRVEPPLAVPWATVEDHILETADGERLGAWLLRPAEGAERADALAVLLLHGNGGSRGATLPLAKLLVEGGHTALAITMRAHGDSTGERNDFGRSAALDVAAAVDLLEAACPGQRIVVQGSSLGSAAAIFAAGRLGTRVAGYVLECPYLDLRTAVRNRTRIALPPLLAEVAYLGLVLVAPLVLDDPDSIAPIARIGDIPAQVPVLILAGALDRHALPEEAEALRAAIASRARLEIFPEGGHEGLLASDSARYARLVLDFLGSLTLTR